MKNISKEVEYKGINVCLVLEIMLSIQLFVSPA